MRRILLLLLLLLAGVLLHAQPQTQFRSKEKGLVLADVENSEFHSRFTGYEYRIYVSLPKNYAASDKRYPVLYVPDADFAFDAARTAYETISIGPSLRMGPAIDELIIVGVPLKVENTLDWARKRFYDLTPTVDEEATASFAKQFEGEVRSGGAAVFLRALQQEVIPYIEANYRTTTDRGLAGYSLGGLFTFWVMLQDQTTFSRYMVGSPSLWWDNAAILKAEAAFAEAGKKFRGKAYFSVGTGEGKMMLDPFRQLLATLTTPNNPDFRYDSHIFEGSDHLSGVAGAFSAAMKYLYAFQPAKR